MRSSHLVLFAVVAVCASTLSIRQVDAHQTGAAPSAPPAAAAPTPPVLPSPVPGADDPHRHKLAVSQFLAWQSGTVDRTLFTDEINSQLSDESLDRGTRALANMGALQSAAFLGTSKTHGFNVFVYKMTCEHGSVNMDFALDPSGKISLIFFE